MRVTTKNITRETNLPKVSIIIPTKKIDAYVERCVKACGRLAWEGEAPEIIVVTDEDCPGMPAAKRNWAMKRANGEIFAFIDSDAYPSHYWLTHALYWLKCFDAVCGPGVLPPNAPYMEQVADQVYKWVFCPYRVTPKAPRMVPWHPTFNLIVKREVATAFPSYMTGEDDKFGLAIKDGIFYHPDILVYHNRRGAFKPLWKQFGTYARHKGTFKALALIAFLTTLWTYAINWVKGFIWRKP